MIAAVIRLIAAAGLMVTLTSCHLLLLSPCATGQCGWAVSSIPPHRDVIARALRGDPDRIEEPLTSLVLSQYTALGRRWPATPMCEHIAAPGCRYTVPVRVTRVEGLKSEFGGCALMELAVIQGKDGLPEVKRTSYASMTCPQSVLTSPKSGG